MEYGHGDVQDGLKGLADIKMLTIQDADRPIGTHIFTAVERTGAEIRWSVVSLVTDSGDEVKESITQFR